MKNKKIGLFLIHFSFLILCAIPNMVLSQEENWVEVAEFSQGQPWFGDTTSFKIDYSQWRILWEYEIDLVNLTAFFFEVKHNDTGQIIDSYFNSGKLDITQGIYNITDQKGEFYLFIGSNAKSYSIIIEQNIDSVPEFTSLLILPIVLGLSIVVFVARNKMKKNGLEWEDNQ